jgi:hypothetical protein
VEYLERYTKVFDALDELAETRLFLVEQFFTARIVNLPYPLLSITKRAADRLVFFCILTDLDLQLNELTPR